MSLRHIWRLGFRFFGTPPELHFVFLEFSWTPMAPRWAERRILTLSWSFGFGFLNWNGRFWVFRSEERWEKASKWEKVIWRLGWCWAGETEGQFGYRRWSRLRVHKKDKTFHIKSWFSYFPLLGFENAIMLGWEAQSTTFRNLNLFLCFQICCSKFRESKTILI